MDTTGMGIGMWLIWIVGILVVIIVVKLSMNSNTGKSGPYSRSPTQILEQRFARGEINKNEFESLKKELEELRK